MTCRNRPVEVMKFEMLAAQLALRGWRVRGLCLLTEKFAIARELLTAFRCFEQLSCFSVRKQVGGLQLATVDRLLLSGRGGTEPLLTCTEKDE